MKEIWILLLLLFTFSCSTDGAKNNLEHGWSLVYKHDKNGRQIFGSKQNVIDAVRNGLSVKVGYGMQRRDKRTIEHLAEAQFLTVINVKDTTEVFAQISPIMRQGPFRLQDTIGIKLVPGFQWLTAIGTNGMCSNVMVNTFEDTSDGSNQKRRGANWFVQYPPNFKPKNESLVN